MNLPALYVFFVLAMTIVLFASNRLRLDVIAGMVIVALAAPGILTPAEAVSGFGNSLVLLIAGLFVVSEGLSRTGVASRIGLGLTRVFHAGETGLLLLLMPTVAVMSAFMSSTGVVALFIPVVLSIAREAGLSPSRLLLPVAVASLIGGMLTLIGTPPNLVAHQTLVDAGLTGFGFFDFGLVGGLVLLLSITYLLTLGRRWLPSAGKIRATPRRKRLVEMAKEFEIDQSLFRLQVQEGSALIGKTVSEAAMRREYQVTVLALLRQNRLMSSLQPVLKETHMQEGDELIVMVEPQVLARHQAMMGVRDKGFPHGLQRRFRQNFGVAEVLVPPASPLVGKTLLELNLRQRQRINVLSIRRGDGPMALDFASTCLEVGDILLIAAAWEDIERLSGPRRDLLLLEVPDEINQRSPRADRAPYAISITVLMLAMMIFELTPNLVAVMLAALAMALTRCIDVEETYRSLNWQSLVVIAGMLPLAHALEKTGGSMMLVSALVPILEDLGPYAVLTGLFLLTSVLSQFISNTATTVLVAPMALALATDMQMAPEPLVMAVALAASTAFATPVASPVNTMIVAPGNYRFMDFVRVGVPLQILALLISVVLIPWVFPLKPV